MLGDALTARRREQRLQGSLAAVRERQADQLRVGKDAPQTCDPGPIVGGPKTDLHLQVQRGSTVIPVTVTPELSKKSIPLEINGRKFEGHAGLIGIAPRGELLFRRYSALGAVARGWEMFVAQVTGTFGAIFSKDVAKNTGGIIMIGSVISADSQAGLRNVLLRAGVLSLSLGICNLFPIPVLDGGHLMLLAWEGIRRRKLTTREVMTAHVCGLSIIAVLFVLITCKDFIQEVLPHLVKHG